MSFFSSYRQISPSFQISWDINHFIKSFYADGSISDWLLGDSIVKNSSSRSAIMFVWAP